MGSTFRIFIPKLKEKCPLKISRSRRGYIVRMDLRERNWEDTDWINLSLY